MFEILNSIEVKGAAAIIIAAICFMCLERVFPYNKQKLFRDGYWLDMIWYNAVQSYVLAVIIAQIIGWIDSATGLTRVEIITHWPIWAQVTLFIVTHDLYIYLFHRWQHRNKYLWRLHEAHHSVKDVDWLSGVRSHPIEILINQTIEYAPIILLGAPPEVAIIKGTIGSIWGMYIHSNLNMRTGWLQYIINGPEMHRWHHADQEEAYNTNFATKFAFWDWMFGTAFFPKDRKAEQYGLSDVSFPMGAFAPYDYLRQTLFAFRRGE